jgi:hypothetical protein
MSREKEDAHDRDENNTFLVSALITTRGMAHNVLNIATSRP